MREILNTGEGERTGARAETGTEERAAEAVTVTELRFLTLLLVHHTDF